MNENKYIAGTMRWGVWGANFTTAQYCKAIQHCLEQGITCFDGADIYGHYTTEAAFGQALAEMGLQRNNYQIISKAGILLPDCAPYFATVKQYNTSRQHLLQALHRSLNDLQTDYVDVFLVHRPSPLMQLEEIAAILTYIQEKGLAKKVGVSNFSYEQVELLSTYLPLHYHQFECSLWQPKAFTNSVLHQCQQKNIQAMAWSPLGGGTLGETNNEQLSTAIASMAHKYEVSAAQLAYLFLQSHPISMKIVTGTTQLERLTEAAKTTANTLAESDWFTLYQAAMGQEVP